ncbi:hypothetical protein FC82_GL003237 [Secundilactobacillus collinoides DSM 20515 = JCM 1123]|uniref:Uncharacterized protein n=1 Tax=Secundilactobacillus collinoides DSM 20515 = JCM 1123 TaxID=1423733 RepID=A0A0R2B5F9_SECCO|nr:hypothetical protein FC82_GL003237 [Secundilactobacillus collinoides DSM 20515 = JCM 1123]
MSTSHTGFAPIRLSPELPAFTGILLGGRHASVDHQMQSTTEGSQLIIRFVSRDNAQFPRYVIAGSLQLGLSQLHAF